MICNKCGGEGLYGPAVCEDCKGTGKIEEVIVSEEGVVIPSEDQGKQIEVEESFLEESGDELAPATESEEEPE